MKLPFSKQMEWTLRWIEISEVLHRVRCYRKFIQSLPQDESDGLYYRERKLLSVKTVCGLFVHEANEAPAESRMYKGRCARCCSLLNIQTGAGAPYNYDIEEPSTI